LDCCILIDRDKQILKDTAGMPTCLEIWNPQTYCLIPVFQVLYRTVALLLCLCGICHCSPNWKTYVINSCRHPGAFFLALFFSWSERMLPSANFFNIVGTLRLSIAVMYSSLYMFILIDVISLTSRSSLCMSHPIMYDLSIKWKVTGANSTHLHFYCVFSTCILLTEVPFHVILILYATE
jgi:hypothetical protein